MAAGNLTGCTCLWGYKHSFQNSQKGSWSSVQLSEKDILAASLSDSDPSELNVVEFKCWLKCRGTNTTGEIVSLSSSKPLATLTDLYFGSVLLTELLPFCEFRKELLVTSEYIQVPCYHSFTTPPTCT